MKINCAYKELKDIDLLVPHPRNPNKHGERQIELLAKLIDHHGWRHPIIVSNRSGYICAGHGRLAAAQRLGHTQVPVDFQDFESEAAEFQFLISDNKIAELADHDDAMMIEMIKELDLGDTDFELMGLDDFTITIDEPVEGLTDEDSVPENVETRVKPGDLWQLGNHRLLCGDSTNIQHVERLMGGEKADMVFTDPPYGVDAVGGDKAVGGGKIVKSNRYERIIGDLNKDAAKDAVALVSTLQIKNQIWFGANNYAHVLPESNGWIYWQKNQTGDFADGELAWTSSKGSIKRFEHTWAGLIKASEHGEKRCHPTQKPIALAEWCFETYAANAFLVLDLFLGSGSTLIACEKTNRKCFGMEIDPHYCSVILKRWEDFTGKEAKLIEQPDGDILSA